MKWAFIGLLLFPACVMAGELPSDRTTKPVKVADVPGFCEGVVIDRSGTIFISDAIGGIVYTVSRDGKLTVWAKTGEPNGHKILPDGTHLLCDGKHHAVLHLAADGSFLKDAADSSDCKPLKSPNDLTPDNHGGFYFTDPDDSWKETPTGTVHYVDSTGRVHTVLEGLAYPNGLVLRPDGKTLLLGESGTNRILSFAVTSPGRLEGKKVFADLPSPADTNGEGLPDGMCLDRSGNLYVAHFGMGMIEVLNPSGKIIRRYQAGNMSVSNVALGGPHRDQLYITGALGDREKTPGALFRIDLATNGHR
ncbi:MAG TPA: SMP-30/gluconolactonase/LRE family protein [Bacteroidota bacterium]|nr:SMP-30/gluconolactonase/LRE family protein [Bacteroidota bacterium]